MQAFSSKHRKPAGGKRTGSATPGSGLNRNDPRESRRTSILDAVKACGEGAVSPKGSRRISILDTTLRDGEQMQGISFLPEEKLSIAKMLLEKVGADRIEIASARTSQGEKEAVGKIAAWALANGFGEKVEVLGFVDNGKSQDWVLESGAKTINLLAKGSLKHAQKQLGKTGKEHTSDLAGNIALAKEKGLAVNVYLEDWSSGMLESREYVFRLLEAMAGMPVERIYLADTLGLLAPDETYELTGCVARQFPKMRFEFHAHNDYGLAVANSLAAAKAGCSGVHATINGLGERAGNAALDEIAVALKDKGGFCTGINEKMLGEISRLVEAFSGKRVPQNKPVTGSNAFTQTAGIHADGDRKAGLYESTLRPERFGRERRYALGKLSGKASLEQNLERLGLSLGKTEMEMILERIVKLGDMKKNVNAEDLPFIVADVLDTKEERPIRIESCVVSSGMGIKPTASFVMKANGKEFSESGVGDGGYDAFMNALKRASEKAGLALPPLVDYEVRIPPGGKTDALVETTITWKTAKGTEFCTTGVDSDQVMAAVKATEKMLNAVERKNLRT